jgi:hypothetical protein
MARNNLQSSYRVSLVADGHDIGPASSMTGGGWDSEETKFASSGTDGQQAEGGRPTTGNPTFFFKYNPRQHDLEWLKSLRGWAEGLGKRQKLERTSTGWQAVGEPQTWAGVIKAVTMVDYDANGTTVDTFSIELSADA